MRKEIFLTDAVTWHFGKSQRNLERIDDEIERWQITKDNCAVKNSTEILQLFV